MSDSGTLNASSKKLHHSLSIGVTTGLFPVQTSALQSWKTTLLDGAGRDDIKAGENTSEHQHIVLSHKRIGNRRIEQQASRILAGRQLY